MVENILLDLIRQTLGVSQTTNQPPFGRLALILFTDPAWYVS